MNITGGCHCGKVRFTAEVDPAKVVACHCLDCQILAGAPFRTVVMARSEHFHLTGDTQRYVKTADSGNRRAQVFCPECGTPLYAGAPDNPPVVTIRVGCVDQREQLKPVVQIWQHSAMPWLQDLARLPATPGQEGFPPPP